MALDAIEIRRCFYILSIAVAIIAIVFKTMAVTGFWMKCHLISRVKHCPFPTKAKTSSDVVRLVIWFVAGIATAIGINTNQQKPG